MSEYTDHRHGTQTIEWVSVRERNPDPIDSSALQIAYLVTFRYPGGAKSLKMAIYLDDGFGNGIWIDNLGEELEVTHWSEIQVADG